MRLLKTPEGWVFRDRSQNWVTCSLDGERVEISSPNINGIDFFQRRVWPRIQVLRGRTVLHGSAVSASGKATVIIGPSGVGKSTTAAAMVTSGHYELLSDDVVVLEQHPTVGWQVHPTDDRVRLREQSLEALAPRFERKWSPGDFDPKVSLSNPSRAGKAEPAQLAQLLVYSVIEPSSLSMGEVAKQINANLLRFNPLDNKETERLFKVACVLATEIPTRIVSPLANGKSFDFARLESQVQEIITGWAR